MDLKRALTNLWKRSLPSLLLAPVIVYFLVASADLGLGTLNRMGAGFFPFLLALGILVLSFFSICAGERASPSKDDVPSADLRGIAVIVGVLCAFILFAVVSAYFSVFGASAATLGCLSLAVQKVSLKARVLFLSGMSLVLYGLMRVIGL